VSSALPGLLRDARVRRAVTVPAVALGSAALGSTVGVWAPVAGAVDLARSGRRFPRLRLLSFAWAWTTLETLGAVAASGLWLAGRSGDRSAHYALQRWWAARLVDALHVLTSLSFEIDGLEQLAPGPVVVCARHASIADALLPAWLLGRVGMRPRYVMKDDLLLDPSLDIVGHRIPNHFVDRVPDDRGTELDAIEALARGMGGSDAAVIFPEGMVVTEGRRARALAQLATRDPERAARLATLHRLAPVHPAGTDALLRGAPDADLVLLTHVGLEPLQRVADAPAHVPLAAPVTVRIRRVARDAVPTGADFVGWMDQEWLAADAALGALAGGATSARAEDVAQRG
jgi:1-acyl-sn-glycerol-3-phosphate acyltransferase